MQPQEYQQPPQQYPPDQQYPPQQQQYPPQQQQQPPQQYPPQQYPPQQYPPQQYPPQQYPPQQYPPQQYPPQQYPPQYPPPSQNQVMPMPAPQQQQSVTVQLPAVYFKDALGKLEDVAGLFVKQKFELLEAVTGCETENKYQVFAADKDGEKKKKMILFKCKEKSGFFERQFLSGSCRPFKAKVEHESKIPGAKDGEKCLEFERECNFTCLCFNRPVMKIYLTENTESKKYLGKVMNPCTFCDLQLDLYNEQDEMIYKVIGNCCQLGLCYSRCPFEPCQTVQFFVHDAKTGERLSELMKKTAGCAKSYVSDADNFSLVFPKKSSKEMRAVLMAAVIMLDFMYFEESPADQKNNQNKSGLSFF